MDFEKDELLFQMIDLRRARDSDASTDFRDLPLNRVWATPEYLLSRLVRWTNLLRSEALPSDEAIRLVLQRLRLKGIVHPSCQTTSDFVVSVMEAYHPDFVALGRDHVHQCCIIAEQMHPTEVPHEFEFPPRNWSVNPICLKDFEKEYHRLVKSQAYLRPTSMFDEAFSEFYLLMRPSDALWNYSVGRGFIAAGGHALVRGGQCVSVLQTWNT